MWWNVIYSMNFYRFNPLNENFQSSGWINLICLLQIVSEGASMLSLKPNRSWLIIYRKICVCVHVNFFIEWRIYEGVIRKGDFITNVNTGKTFEVSLRLLTILVLLHWFCAHDVLHCGYAFLFWYVHYLGFMFLNLFIFYKCMTESKIASMMIYSYRCN